MISHEYKCIFIHIPATAGSSIEDWIIGEDWWAISPRTKHLFASQARREYANYWDDYFKFTIVRDPIDRMKSCLRFPEVSFLEIDENGDIDFSRYLDVYARRGVILEYDWRFYERAEVELPRHVPGALYSNILDEKLDFVGRFEELPEVVEALKGKLAIEKEFVSHLHASSSQIASIQVSNATRRQIQEIFWRDYVKFGFEATPDFTYDKLDSSVNSVADIASDVTHWDDVEIERLRNRVKELLLYRDGYRAFIYEMNDKNNVIALLQDTVESLIVDRNAHKTANEAAGETIANLEKQIEDLIAERDAYKAAYEAEVAGHRS